METAQILRDFASTERMPLGAIEAARADRAAVVPMFVRAVEQRVAGKGSPEDDDTLFWVFHLLGEWREKSAYRPLAALLRLEDIGDVLGDAVTETSHRVMAAVFDGDPAPLYDIIRDPGADEFVRSRMCEALAMATLRGEVPREQAALFLRACFSELEPQDDNAVWDGWQSAIAMLGLVELVPLVREAFEREFIGRYVMDFADFEQDLRTATSGAPSLRPRSEREFEPFGDAIQELAHWAFLNREQKTSEVAQSERESDERILWRPSDGPAVNPYKNVGRNDPCPCGSGKKFKKCCLGKAEALPRTTPWTPEPRFEADADFDDVFSDDVFSDDELSRAQAAYDPLIAPDPEEWLALEEDERIAAALEFHRDAGIILPNDHVHAILHVTVENQIAEGDALPVRRTADRLMSEGLDRHDAVHAIGMVLIGHMNDMMKQERVEGDPNPPYFAELERLTAAQWRRSG